MLMSPFFSGNMWGQRFKGRDSEISLTEWVENLNAMFRMYKIPDSVQVDFILNQLEGDAKRQILVTAVENRNTAKKVFDRLQDLYGDKMSASVLRSLCFSCRQQPSETVSDFSLRLQELFKKLQQKDSVSMRNCDSLMRDQFVDGMQDKLLKRELRTLIRSTPDLSFAATYREASIRLEVNGEVGLAACDAVGQVTRLPSTQVDLQQLKKELREEMAAEIKDQMVTLSKDKIPSREHANLDLVLEATPSGRQAWTSAMRLCSEEAKFNDGHGEVSFVRVLTNTEVPPGKEMVLPGRVRGGPGGRPYFGLVEAPPETEAYWVARAVVSAKGNTVPVRLKNLCNRPLFLKKYQKLAQMSLIKPTDVVSGAVQLSMETAGVMEVHLEPEVSLPSSDPSNIPVELENSGLSSKETQEVRCLLAQYRHVFALSDDDYGYTHTVFHEIPTGDSAPVRQRHRQIAPSLYQEVRVLLQDLLEAGIIHKSTSPWASPIVLVKKKDGSTRFCVDYRKLNTLTRKDAFPLPRVEESLTMLSQAKFFSTLDLASGYWQVPVHPEDREKTAFITPMGLYEWDRMPFGLCNGPATFQRLMEACLGDLNFQSLLIYLDDIIIFSPDFSSHLQRLELVFQRLADQGLKLKPSKCFLFQKEVKYLGHVVSEQGIAPLHERVEAIQEWPQPTTVRELRAFLGLTGYYRRFIKDFSKVAMPLNKLLCGQSRNHTRQKTQPLKDWGAEAEDAFQQLRRGEVRQIQADAIWLVLDEMRRELRSGSRSTRGGLDKTGGAE
ncbi:uncharacterized protein LOC134071743 [Sardina pilchardus]|uniref:uncharacterized protein LOC134071743 n=1 Tax=Sardina pilchardus TaxID=27697 RepID=UPI002E0D4E26